MAEEAKKAPVEETKDTKVETPTTEEAKIGDVLKNVKETKETKMVPEAVLIEYKKQAKGVQKELEELKKTIQEGASKKEVSTDLKILSEKHNVDAEFLNEFAAAVRKEADAEFESKLKPFEEEKLAKKREEIFNENFDKTLADNPEYKKLVNKDVIKALAFDAQNSNKTFAQIFQDAYGHLVTGRKTLESTKPRGGKENDPIDVSKAQRDPEYFAEIMADPKRKAEYNENMIRNAKF